MAKYKDKYDLLRLDESGRVSPGMFPENWTRYIVKMATGTGKTKVLGLVLVWSYFHALYEDRSPLSKNFLLIAPNIIVLNDEAHYIHNEAQLLRRFGRKTVANPFELASV